MTTVDARAVSVRALVCLCRTSCGATTATATTTAIPHRSRGRSCLIASQRREKTRLRRPGSTKRSSSSSVGYNSGYRRGAQKDSHLSSRVQVVADLNTPPTAAIECRGRKVFSVRHQIASTDEKRGAEPDRQETMGINR